MLHILLIDDDDYLRSALRLVLTQMGHKVSEARNGAEGLAQFQISRADLVITDIVMPEREGFDVLMSLRKEKPPVKVIAMTGDWGGFRAAHNLRIAKLLGAAKVLEKPFTPEAMAAAIAELLPAHASSGFDARRAIPTGTPTDRKTPIDPT